MARCPKRRLFVCRLGVVLGLLVVATGCGVVPVCPEASDTATTVVLTFDDGPITADVADPLAVEDQAALLDPVDEILATLDANGYPAVFYIKGPGDPAAADALADTFATGLTTIADAGYVLGYHAYNHSEAIWIGPFDSPGEATAGMRSDLDALQAYLDHVLGLVGREESELFTPVFRQPFGGGFISRWPAVLAAHERGWVYHGYWIDSLDWLVNANADLGPLGGVSLGSEDDHVALVRQRLLDGAIRSRDRPIVDVLFHVNARTAAHLPEFIDELDTDFTGTRGSAPVFAVPGCYLTNDDFAVDITGVLSLVVSPGP